MSQAASLQFDTTLASQPPEPTHTLVGIDDIRAARELLRGVVRDTPLTECAPLSTKLGGPAYLKCESLQRAGSFKVRGAYVRMARLSDAERARGVVAASAGNHAQGVAVAANLLGSHATVFMPRTAPLTKVTATKAYGATVRLIGVSVADALVAAKDFAEQTGAVFIHPFDHPDVIAGQGTVGLELLEQCPELSTVLVSMGGGGLISGVAVALKAVRPDIQVVGVQASASAAFAKSLQVGQPVTLKTTATIADGIAVNRPGELTFAHVRELVDDVVTVSDEDLARALLFCFERAKLVVEPAGVAGVAAMLADPRRFTAPIATVLTGGNIDPLLMLRVIEHGLAAAGRYLYLMVRATDRPGNLASTLALLAEQGVNVLDVEHFRHDSRLRLGEAVIALSVETRGSEHSEQLLEILRHAGVSVMFPA
ncbi:MAG: threonine ammonia-lyase [Acidimicrobiales bacterium]|nr:MAG: threonine ammonia-lyase [Acidimicrobiales bacterium]